MCLKQDRVDLAEDCIDPNRESPLHALDLFNQAFAILLSNEDLVSDECNLMTTPEKLLYKTQEFIFLLLHLMFMSKERQNYRPRIGIQFYASSYVGRRA